MYIEEVIDAPYGPTPRLTDEDLKFTVELNEAKNKLDARLWYHNKTIDELDFDELMMSYAILIDNNTLFFRDQWRKIILEEIHKKLKLSKYEIH